MAKAVPLPPLPSQGLHLASLLHFSGSRPDNLGVTSGELAPCPSSPNCVSSQSSDLEHKTAPLPIQESPNQAIQRLQEILEAQDNAEIITAEPDYLYAEFTSNIMGFVDDVEFWADTDENVIQVRSASRLGESDLGVNRQRVESIRAKFAPELS
ncbi:MAG: DUF1499 domain-containing protein [Sodalinema sp.]|uniref:DUF1499 domain-containing protein n=1 Tax=Sodalinema sp. TaxID=3080550 RepID=UPI0012195E10|nr:MAG: DUF1499 domain-containing protein [Phormidium sp. SL48-SHIP]